MRYGGNFMSNFSGATKYNDSALQQDMILDEVAIVIAKNPSLLASALRNAGVRVSSNPSREELIDHTSREIYTNAKFQNSIASIISKKSYNGEAYSNLNPEEIAKVAGSSASTSSQNPKLQVGADPISAIAGAIGSAFSFAAAKQQEKANKEATKAKLYDKIFGDQKKNKNLLPIIIVTTVLIIGGAVAFIALKKK